MVDASTSVVVRSGPVGVTAVFASYQPWMDVERRIYTSVVWDMATRRYRLRWPAWEKRGARYGPTALSVPFVQTLRVFQVKRPFLSCNFGSVEFNLLLHKRLRPRHHRFSMSSRQDASALNRKATTSSSVSIPTKQKQNLHEIDGGRCLITRESNPPTSIQACHILRRKTADDLVRFSSPLSLCICH